MRRELHYSITLLSILLFLSCSPKNNYVLSSRWFHPRGQNDTVSTQKVIEELNPKRVEWIYYENDAILHYYKSKGLPYSLALNPQIPDSSGYTTTSTRIIDYKGNPFIAPWMKDWKIKNPYWGCVNNPQFNKIFIERGLFLAGKGAYALVVDDALFNLRLQKDNLVGCFCKHCTQKFNTTAKAQNHGEELKRSLLKNQGSKNNFSGPQKAMITEYISFQEESVVNFLKHWQASIRAKYPKIKFITNNYNGSWNNVYSTFDGGIGELNEKFINENDLDSLYALADSKSKTQLFTCSSENLKVQQALLQYNKENNRESIIPWDVYISGSKRLYIDVDKLKLMLNKK